MKYTLFVFLLSLMGKSHDEHLVKKECTMQPCNEVKVEILQGEVEVFISPADAILYKIR